MDERHILLLGSNFPPYTSITWNSSGHVIDINGTNPVLFDLIATRFHWTYSWKPLGRNMLLNNAPNKKGLIGYLQDGDADTLIATMLPLRERYQLIDFTMPTSEGPDSALIPYPSTSTNDYALGQPFQKEVWALLAVSIIFLSFSWYLLLGTAKPRNKLSTPVDYAITVLLNQGNACRNRAIYIRLIAGAWCLAAAVLVPAYGSIIISHLTLPLEKPLINSVYDIVDVPGLKIAVDRGQGVDLMLKQFANLKEGSLAKVAKATQDTMFRCNISTECYDKVLGGDYVYIHATFFLKRMILKDFEKHMKCRTTLAKELVLSETFPVWGVAKRNQAYLKILNKGILETNAFGLWPYWRDYYFKTPRKCIKVVQAVQKRRLSFAETSSTLVLLLVGSGESVSLLV